MLMQERKKCCLLILESFEAINLFLLPNSLLTISFRAKFTLSMQLLTKLWFHCFNDCNVALSRGVIVLMTNISLSRGFIVLMTATLLCHVVSLL